MIILCTQTRIDGRIENSLLFSLRGGCFNWKSSLIWLFFIIVALFVVRFFLLYLCLSFLHRSFPLHFNRILCRFVCFCVLLLPVIIGSFRVIADALAAFFPSFSLVTAFFFCSFDNYRAFFVCSLQYFLCSLPVFCEIYSLNSIRYLKLSQRITIFLQDKQSIVVIFRFVILFAMEFAHVQWDYASCFCCCSCCSHTVAASLWCYYHRTNAK